MQAEEILQGFHALLDDLNTRLAVLEQTIGLLTPATQRQALATMLTDHAQQCLVLALSSTEARHG